MCRAPIRTVTASISAASTLRNSDRKLTNYTFETGAAKHFFCSVCGIKSFYVPRSHPDGYSVNFRCLNAEEFRSETDQLHIRDGRGEAFLLFGVRDQILLCAALPSGRLQRQFPLPQR